MSHCKKTKGCLEPNKNSTFRNRKISFFSFLSTHRLMPYIDISQRDGEREIERGKGEKDE